MASCIILKTVKSLNMTDDTLLSSDSIYFLKKVEAIEEMEDLGLCTDEMYLDKIQLLQKIAKGNLSETQRVWGEYSIVSQITSQPVLMNKAMSIALTKDEVADLMDDLNNVYSKQLKLLNARGKAGLIFSVTDRGHAKSSTFAITLPKLGDWRFGYTGVYSAELIFHEFSHILDFGRTSPDHRHDFVKNLDTMILKYKDFIEERYIPINQRNQILENSDRLLFFHANKDFIQNEFAKEEREELSKKKSEQAQIYSEIGLTENSFPLSYIIGDNAEVKKSYLKFILDSYKDKARTPQQKTSFKSITSKLNDDNIILDSDEIKLLNDATKSVTRTSFLNTLPFKEQITAGSYLSKFEKDIDALSKGTIENLSVKEKYQTRSYDEAKLLKKYNLED
jgi:hypothetical protein